MPTVRDALDDFLRQATLLAIAAAIALGYAVLSLAQGVAALVLSVFTERDDQFGSGFGTLSLDVGSRSLEFGQLVSGVVIVVVVLGAILYVVKPDLTDQAVVDEEPSGS